MVPYATRKYYLDYSKYYRESGYTKRTIQKYQNGIKEVCLDMYDGFGERYLIENLFWKCKGIEKFTYKKATISDFESEFPDPRCILSSSLTALKLIAKHLRPEALPAYSRAFPELRNLPIETIYRLFDSLSFIVNMSKTKINHLKVYFDIGLPIKKDKLHKPVLLEILSKKSCQKQFLANITLSNQLEEFSMATNKEYGYIIAIKCTSIDFISISFNEMHILKEYPLSL